MVSKGVFCVFSFGSVLWSHQETNKTKPTQQPKYTHTHPMSIITLRGVVTGERKQKKNKGELWCGFAAECGECGRRRVSKGVVAGLSRPSPSLWLAAKKASKTSGQQSLNSKSIKYFVIHICCLFQPNIFVIGLK